MRSKDNPDRERCDHCKKWVSEHNHPLSTLEGIVSEGVEISFAICESCFERKGLDRDYWDKWVERVRQRNNKLD